MTIKSIRGALLLAGVLFVTGLLALSTRSGYANHHKPAEMNKSITIMEPWVRAAPPVAKRTGGYLVIKNNADRDDALTAVSMDLPGMLEVHGMRTTNGMMEMFPLEMPVVIRAGETLTLQPGGKHLMLMNLKRGPQTGDRITFTLTFRHGGTHKVTAPVKESAGMGGMKMKH